jgi:hypothetical protein
VYARLARLFCHNNRRRCHHPVVDRSGMSH